MYTCIPIFDIVKCCRRANKRQWSVPPTRRWIFFFFYISRYLRMILCTAKCIQKRFRFECVDERIFFSFWEKNVEHNTTRKTPNFVPFSFFVGPAIL